jgi:hypothetical protein
MMHYRELLIRNVTGRSLSLTTFFSTRSQYLPKKYPTSTCPEGSRYLTSLFFQVVKIRWSIWIIFDLTYPCTRHLTLWRAEIFLSPCQERPETGSKIFPQGRLIVLTLLEGNSWPSSCPEEPEENPEGTYSLCGRDRTSL